MLHSVCIINRVTPGSGFWIPASPCFVHLQTAFCAAWFAHLRPAFRLPDSCACILRCLVCGYAACFLRRMACSYADQSFLCTLGVFSALAFTADFPPAALKFYQRTHRVRLKNLNTSDKKSSRKIKHKKIPRAHKVKSRQHSGGVRDAACGFSWKSPSQVDIRN